jgi:alkanesulfonate monooxygenase SsuD/methylene tetrahydromethanopterin reductase-like flavin-dependent oxidoreductase (luciferase family)
MVARQTASLDHLSGGRLVFGSGIGVHTFEFDDLGEVSDQRTRGEMLDEGLQILTGLWCGEPFNHQGKHYTVKDAHFLPPPAQQPRIPVWIAGVWPNKRPFRRAAEWDGVFAITHDAPDKANHPPEMVREVVDYVSEHRKTDQPFDVIIHGMTPGANPAVAGEIVAPYAAAGATWWQERILESRQDYPAAVYETPLEAFRARILQGPPRLD